MGSNHSVLGLTLPWLVLAVVPSALVSAGATRAHVATCGPLNRATGPAAAGELSNAAFVSAGESWAVGNVGSALKPNQTLIERFNGSAWSVVQQPDRTFVDEAYRENVTDPWGRGRYGAVLDANNDGYPDIFYGTDSLRPDGLPSIDRFYINTGNGSFSDNPAMGLDLNVGSLCAHTVDYNSDGWPDLLVCGETGGLHLFENDQGQGFTPQPTSMPRTDPNGLFHSGAVR